MAALCFLLSLMLADAGPSSLPDSVLPCVPCHNRAGSAQVGEWLASPYSEAEGGRGCADCHGEHCRGNSETGFLPDRRTAGDLRSLQEAVSLSVTAICSGDAVDVEVAVSNVGVGHLLPAGRGERTLLLEIHAHDRNLEPLAGWAGSRRLELPPFATDVSRYHFTASQGGPAHVSARLVLAPTDGPPLEIAEAATVCGASGEAS